ncbi:iron-sulfur cluster assembly protein [Lichenicoccus sp.]|uniref:iron-sulfur cluster assembly protein n=1 Tax=Lichenicoccus sp. TaxID=2781899 RepID=UPI003D0FD377
MASAVQTRGNGDRVSEVLARLARVDDPELDESVIELGFVTGVAVDEAGGVELGFRLPTYWCAANFAFLMADDMRREVGSLPWVGRIRIELGAHMYADTINRAMATGQSFQQAFAEEADGNLDEVRRIFALKAFQRRQLAVLNHLSDDGHAEEAVLGLSIGGLRGLGVAPEGRRLIERYLDRRAVPGPAGAGDPAFVDEQGRVVSVASFAAHRRALRRVTVNVEFNGALCRGLLAARFGEEQPASTGEPTLLDFVRGQGTQGPRAGRPVSA